MIICIYGVREEYNKRSFLKKEKKKKKKKRVREKDLLVLVVGLVFFFRHEAKKIDRHEMKRAAMKTVIKGFRMT